MGPLVQVSRLYLTLSVSSTSHQRCLFGRRGYHAAGDKELAQIRNRHFGFIFQSYNLFPELTALENVMVPMMYARLPKRERIERAKQLLAQVEMDHRFDHFPNQLSGGEQQRVAIARALANNPTLIWHELTGNLATEQSMEIMELLRTEQRGTTVVMVHNDPLISSFEAVGEAAGRYF